MFHFYKREMKRANKKEGAKPPAPKKKPIVKKVVRKSSPKKKLVSSKPPAPKKKKPIVKKAVRKSIPKKKLVSKPPAPKKKKPIVRKSNPKKKKILDQLHKMIQMSREAEQEESIPEKEEKKPYTLTPPVMDDDDNRLIFKSQFKGETPGISSDSPFNFSLIRKDCITEKKIRDPKTLQCMSPEQIETKYHPTKTYSWLEGPICLAEFYSDKYKKHIYLFGDEHTSESTCSSSKSPQNTVSIHDLLRNTFLTNTDKAIDLVVESTAFMKGIYQFDSNYLDDIWKTYSSCFTRESKECPYDNLRYHETDVRRTLSILHLFLVSIYEGEMKQAFKAKVVPRIDEILEELSYDPHTGHISLDKIYQKSRLNKQLDKISYPEVRTLLDQYKKTHEEQLLDALNYFVKIMLTYKQKKKVVLEEKEYDHHCGDMLCWIQDIYTISRMFRPFRPTVSYSQPMHSVLYYAGFNHTLYVGNLLHQLGFQMVYFEADRNIPSNPAEWGGTHDFTNKPGRFQCLDIATLPQPLFHRDIDQNLSG